ncbi:hypothetical protein CHS0354_012011 [Potamilus streckersoni]|uniref:Uncharacterized protein n=1 Tax=Potamilus streckersoni TaxID=2493646 RepID=A0AAE0SBU5_9BIVA|nr:hypothetical protein CHS0354_012011 [Potamilus streckersoni]
MASLIHYAKLSNEMRKFPCKTVHLSLLYFSADDFTTGYMQSKAMVDYTGIVFWPPPAKFRSSCKIDITYFPFDDQSCKMKFGSWIYDGFQVDVTNRSDKVDLANYVYSGEWELLLIKVVRNEVRYACCQEFYPDVTFTIYMRRRTMYYLFNIIFPCLWLTILSLLGFWLPPDSGEKITLGITVLLAFSVFMLLIAENMPATSEFVPLIGIYLTVTMGMTSLSIILTVFVLQLHHVGPHQRGVPRWLRILSYDIMSNLLCMRPKVNPFMFTYNRIRRDEMTMSSFADTYADNPPNCNGGVTQSSQHMQHEKIIDIDETQEKITNHLKHLVSKQDYEEHHQDIVNEWRFVATIMDRFLFWIFLLASVLSSVVILVIVPMRKPPV